MSKIAKPLIVITSDPVEVARPKKISAPKPVKKETLDPREPVPVSPKRKEPRSCAQ